MTWPAIAAMDQSSFVQTFGGIYEHSPWLAEAVFRGGLNIADDHVDGLHHRLSTQLSQASREQQLALIQAHPDLAGKAALAGRVTADSAAEQSSAGLDQCSAEELEQFRQLNTAYLDKFGFPFIIAVKGLDRSMILQSFAQRLENSPELEFDRALLEINRIARFRLEAL